MILGRWFDAYRTDRFVLSSPLSVGEIIASARRAGATGFRSYLVFGSAPVSGRASSDRLVLVRRSWSRNSWRPILVAHLQPSATGSVLSCEVRPYLVVIVFSAIWFGLASILSIACVLGVVAGADPIALVALAFPVFFIAITSLGTWLARGDRQFLRDVVHEIARAPRG